MLSSCSLPGFVFLVSRQGQARLLQHQNLGRRSQSQPSETSSWYNCQYNDVCIVRPSLLPRYYWHLEILSGSRSDIKTNVRQWLIYQHIAHSHLPPALPPEKCDVYTSPLTCHLVRNEASLVALREPAGCSVWEKRDGDQASSARFPRVVTAGSGHLFLLDVSPPGPGSCPRLRPPHHRHCV